MALLARRTLEDCETAYKLLKNEKNDSPTWRVHWVACLALLRTVGHVLKNADGVVDAKHKYAITTKWNEWKADKAENAIFWNFIEVERNSLLKEYKFGVEPEPICLITENGELIVTEEGSVIVLEDEFFRLSPLGFEEKEGRDVIHAAIDWWRRQLEAIEDLL